MAGLRLISVIILMTIIFPVFPQKNKSMSGFSGFDKGYIKLSYNYFPSFSEVINDDVEAFGLEKFDKTIFLWGGELCANMNSAFGLGIQYYTGSDISDRIVTLTLQDMTEIKLDRSVTYGISFIGLAVNYRKSMRGVFDFFGTVSAGYGSVKIMISQDFGDQYYEDLWSSFDPDSGINDYNRSTIYDPSLYIFRAENGLRFYAGKRLSFDLTAGYAYGFVSDRGEINYGFESLKNVPDLDFKGMTYGLGISFGY
ncbi:MAG: hypothetical protein AB7V07_01745 [Candidatus Delongbacteria bacterium]